ncbi:hypothetical protein LEP1GSC161_3367 [Leptospira santarosai str. CBC1416]|uniref:Uncharacterized protein n=1 Tax=Leptospira santarosai str. CBC1416 TaxID=1193059 RepID=M6VSL2_9LEPT|nr:hypothetical protein LEP1GSC161_3367 [Leptospira santarosai str. CBC1416]
MSCKKSAFEKPTIKQFQIVFSIFAFWKDVFELRIRGPFKKSSLSRFRGFLKWRLT